MKRFDKKGMMIFPNPYEKDNILQSEKILVIEECYCPQGHSLISTKAMFNKFKGILFLAKHGKEKGLVALSPVYGVKSRITLDLELKDGEIWKFHCPDCEVALPYYTRCKCGGNLTTFFTSKDADYNHSIGICNRVGCQNASIHLGEELLTQSMLESY